MYLEWRNELRLRLLGNGCPLIVLVCAVSDTDAIIGLSKCKCFECELDCENEGRDCSVDTPPQAEYDMCAGAKVVVVFAFALAIEVDVDVLSECSSAASWGERRKRVFFVPCGVAYQCNEQQKTTDVTHSR